MAVMVTYLHPRVNEFHVGFIPRWLSVRNPKSAREQLDENYQHGGGWIPIPGFKLGENNVLIHPSSPPFFPIAAMRLRQEFILVYEQHLVAIVQPDKSFEVAVMD